MVVGIDWDSDKAIGAIATLGIGGVASKVGLTTETGGKGKGGLEGKGQLIEGVDTVQESRR